MATDDIMSTSDRVKQICNDLYRQNGTKPSVRLVLSMLPDISSTSTVHKPLKEWTEELEASQQSIYDKLGFSPDFTQAFMQEITRFGVEAEERYKHIASTAKEQRDSALEDLERAEEKYYKQQAVLEQREKELKALKGQLAESNKAHDATTAELRNQLKDQEKANKELRESNEALRTDMAKVNVQLDHNNQLVHEVKGNATDQANENRELRDKVSELTKHLATLESRSEGLDQLIEQLKVNENRYKDDEKALIGEKNELVTETARLRQQLDDTSRRMSESTVKLNEQSQLVTELRGTIAEQSSVIKRLTGTS